MGKRCGAGIELVDLTFKFLFCCMGVLPAGLSVYHVHALPSKVRRELSDIWYWVVMIHHVGDRN